MFLNARVQFFEKNSINDLFIGIQINLIFKICVSPEICTSNWHESVLPLIFHANASSFLLLFKIVMSNAEHDDTVSSSSFLKFFSRLYIWLLSFFLVLFGASWDSCDSLSCTLYSSPSPTTIVVSFFWKALFQNRLGAHRILFFILDYYFLE